jgi:hypothetical protein
MRLKPLESDIQMAIIQAFRLKHRITLYETDAGGGQTRRLNQIPVMMTPQKGLLILLSLPESLPFGISPALILPAGFSDLMGAVAAGFQSGDDRLLFLEVKRPGQKPRLNQLQFMAARRAEGHMAIWADSVESALEQFEEAR